MGMFDKLGPVPNVMPLRCQTKNFKVSFWFKHGSSMPFESIKLGTAEFSLTWLLSMADLALPHSSSTTWFQTACFSCAELNVFKQCCSFNAGWMVCFVVWIWHNWISLPFETDAVLIRCATAKLNSFEFGTAVARHLKQA